MVSIVLSISISVGLLFYISTRHSPDFERYASKSLLHLVFFCNICVHVCFALVCSFLVVTFVLLCRKHLYKHVLKACSLLGIELGGGCPCPEKSMSMVDYVVTCTAESSRCSTQMRA